VWRLQSVCLSQFPGGVGEGGHGAGFRVPGAFVWLCSAR
jgi:hypothetical protein